MSLRCACRSLLSLKSLGHVTGRRRPVRRSAVGVVRCLSILQSLSFSEEDKRREYVEQKILGYTPEQVFNVVANISEYCQFLPWCKESVVVRERPGMCTARLVVGFPPLVESYTSLIIFRPNELVRSISTDGRLFSHLENQWHIRPGPHYPTGPSSIVNIKGSFEFRSMLYASMGSLFFDEVARTLAQSFAARCRDLYGPDHMLRAANRSRNSTTRPLDCLTQPIDTAS